MITNETRAKLIGWERRMIPVMHGGFAEADGPVYPEPYWFAPDGSRRKSPLPYDTDANAVAELRAFVRARGKEFDFVLAVWREVVGYIPMDPTEGDEFDFLDATPAQQCAAFDAVFADDLERIHET